MEHLIDLALLAFLVVLAIGMVRLRNLFAVVMLFGIYSLLSAALFVALDAVDVAFTEAAVGAGISTILMLATLALTNARERSVTRRRALALAICTVTGLVLVSAMVDLPVFGALEAPAHAHVVPRYLLDSYREIGVPNVVTSVLASYRGYDTLGEVTVIFTAGLGVLCVLGAGREPPADDREDG
ncbi:MAG: DUF4040 domain-containing protein [Ectothiorhodospiraceae bacterium]|nr:DUF4040 domain-containing protein [Chromatiales bacterium]MCP5157200.1 DUF4040 domain-containing protein [Ectothiorhodospiraceae bacterium]